MACASSMLMGSAMAAAAASASEADTAIANASSSSSFRSCSRSRASCATTGGSLQNDTGLIAVVVTAAG